LRPPVRPNERPFTGGDSADEAARVGRARSKRGASDKRERILRAAIRVFARKGFYATRVAEIAKAARVADGTIYLYFKNKDDVLISIFEDRITKLIAFLRAEVEKDAPWDERFRRVIELQLGLLEGQRDLAEVITVNLRQSSRLLKQYATPLFTRYLEVIASLIAEGQREGLVRTDVHPRVVARALWGALDGIAVTWALGRASASPGDPKPGQLQRAASQLATVFLEGVRVR
jgi:TetR/AcrR family fatty acid metabolism transcriptional regulator